jgi:hypothetical protein
MKPEEKSAFNFLKSRLGVEPTYEPLGKSRPPDFAVAKSAFEVRRLNQRYFHQDGTNEGLEELEIPLAMAVRRELSQVPFAEDKGSFFWGLDFRRPLSARVPEVARAIATRAQGHYLSGQRQRTVVLEDHVSLELIPASASNGKAFTPGYRADGDSGGAIGQIYPASIEVALNEKISKTRAVSTEFDRWELILVDFILGFEPGDVGTLSGLNFGHFNSIAVIDLDGRLIFEWPEDAPKGL